MENRKKLAIIGASLFQNALIVKAKEMGLETHVFAWKTGDIGETLADYFYPISTRDKDAILDKCREIEIDGITSIGSDIAMDTVNYVACEMGLIGNSIEAARMSTNKHWMREAFERGGDPSPKSVLVDKDTDFDSIGIEFPVVVKPTDRSGSRGVTLIDNMDELREAVSEAVDSSWEKKALIEEYALGEEYSIEYISYKGKHWMLAATHKTTTGAPYFMETGHVQPAPLSDEMYEKVRKVCDHALDTLMLENGAAHIELKIDDNDNIKLIEIGGRMGGGFIGSDLVELSTGYDYVRAVAEVAIGNELSEPEIKHVNTASVRFIITEDDYREYLELKEKDPGCIVRAKVHEHFDHLVHNIDERDDYYIYIIR